MILKGLEKRLVKYDIRKVTECDFEDVYNLQLTNPEYFSSMQEHEVTLEECIEGTRALPPGTDAEQKFFIIFYKETKLQIIMDIIMDYPDKSVAWLGLLMIDGNLKRMGLGRKVIEASMVELKSNGIKSVQLGVIEGNKDAHSFWKSMKFTEIRRSKMVEEDDSVINVIVMERTV
jgi:N-acetylglutamate synthase-like GNAT family acetyltransferase